MKKLFGDKIFYKMVLTVAVPIMIQNGITNFVSLLDNIMVGRIGTEQMSGVAIVNQLLFIYMISVFGGVSGAGVFTAQYYGHGDHEGVRNTFRFKMMVCLSLSLIFLAVMMLWGKGLIGLYLHDSQDGTDIVRTAEYAWEYLKIMLIQMLPFAIVQAYVSTLRETGETVLPMIAGMVAVFVNLGLNYILIFGKLGAPELGVRGAAIATVISRFVELTIIVAWTHIHHEKNRFIEGAYRSLLIPKQLAFRIIAKGTPLFLNEGLWSAGQAMITQCYSVRGLSVVAGLNIASTITNLFNIVFMSLGSSVAIIVGQKLGTGNLEDARITAYRMITFSVLSCVVVSAVMIGVGRLFPGIYNVTDEVKQIASQLIVVTACVFPIQAYLHAAYFTIRSGGKTFITFLFDSCFCWVVSIPLATALAHLTHMPIMWMFLCVQLADLIKCVIGYILLKSGIWLNNIVSQEK